MLRDSKTRVSPGELLHQETLAFTFSGSLSVHGPKEESHRAQALRALQSWLRPNSGGTSWVGQTSGIFCGNLEDLMYQNCWYTMVYHGIPWYKNGITPLRMDWFNNDSTLWLVYTKTELLLLNGFLSISGLFSEISSLEIIPSFGSIWRFGSTHRLDCSLKVCCMHWYVGKRQPCGKRTNHVCSQLQTSQLSPRLQQKTLGSLRSTSPSDTRTADCRDPRNPVLGRDFWSIRKTLRTTSWHNWHWVLGSKGKPWLSILQKTWCNDHGFGAPWLNGANKPVKPSRLRWPQLEPP